MLGIMKTTAMIFAIGCSGACLLAQQPNFAKKDIAQFLSSQRDQITSYYARTIRTQKSIRPDPSPAATIYPSLQYLERVEAWQGNKMRFQSRNGPSAEKLASDVARVWDGQTMKQLSDNRLGEVAADAKPYQWKSEASPLTMAMMVDSVKSRGRADYNIDVVRLLESERCVLKPQKEDVNGTSCVVASLEFDGRVNRKVWLDPQRGFAVMRYEMYNPKRPDQLVFSAENTKLAQFPNGLYLPVESTQTWHLTSGPDQEIGQPTLVSTFKTTELKIAEDLPDEVFHVTFKEGLHVIDKIRGVTFTAGMTSVQEALDDSIRKMGQLQKEADVRPAVGPLARADAQSPMAPAAAPAPQAAQRQHASFRLWAICLALAALLASTVAVVLQKSRKARIEVQP